MKKVCIIGAGQLGSRHLQALVKMKFPLKIFVIDPNENSLRIAKERYESVSLEDDRNILLFYKDFGEIKEKVIDIAIIATNSNVRKEVTLSVLKQFDVNFIVFEKLLFQYKDDYDLILNLLQNKGTTAYVNCSMRMMSFYNEIKAEFEGTPFKYIVSGSQFGLVTNLIHYLDHIVFLNGDHEFKAETTFLDKEIIDSKRVGFKELTGTYMANFRNGTQGIFTCYSSGNSPTIIQAFNEKIHFISKESEGKVWLSKGADKWQWREIDFKIPFQSQLTTLFVDELIENGKCQLPLYTESAKTHILLLDSLLDFINDKTEYRFNYYPFT